jgi:NADH:ubiquinone oxidoreductase subunit K
MVFTHIFLRKKQSSKEPDSDERDDLIKRRAVLVSFVSVWILLAAATLIPGIILGQTGTISAYILPFINVSIFLIAMMVYSVAILVQYGWGTKGEKT